MPYRFSSKKKPLASSDPSKGQKKNPTITSKRLVDI
jgi:hypothetical protein